MKQGNESAASAESKDYSYVFAIIISFFSTFIPETLVKRAFCIFLIAAGLENAKITACTGYCDRSVREVRKQIKEGKDISEILKISGGGRTSRLEDYADQIIAELESNNYFSRKQVVAMIKQKFDITVSSSAVGRFLKRHGYRKLKAGSLPAKADVEKQLNFHDNILIPLLEKAKKGEIKVFFLDAAHFVMGSDFLGRIYCRKRRFMKTFSGRKRYNVLGALDFSTKGILKVSNDTYITATEICEMLKLISNKFPNQEIHILLDNARYQKCQAVLTLAENLGITLDYIPPYSPNLNLIERLWKFIKGKLRSEFYDDFNAFKSRIDSVIENPNEEEHAEIQSLIGEEFQLFDDLIQIGPDTWEKSA